MVQEGRRLWVHAEDRLGKAGNRHRRRMERLQVGGKERLMLLSHDLVAAAAAPGGSNCKVWRPQLLLLLHMTPAGGSSNSLARW